MPGVQNSKKNGLYAFVHPLIVNGSVVPGGTVAPQQLILANSQATLENSGIDTTHTIHPITISTPSDPGAITGTTNSIGKAVSGYSKTFMVNGYPALQSGTKKLQNAGNCPISPMVSNTSGKSYVYVSS